MKKGITVVSVAIMIAVIMMLLGTVTISSYNSIQNAKKISFSLELSSIQEKVDRYMNIAQDDDYPILTNSYTVSLSNISANALKQFEQEIIDSNNELILYELDLAAIGIEDNEYGNKDTEKDVYVLSKKTNKVYYLEGVKSKDTTYYTLTDDLISISKRNETKKDNDVDETAAPAIMSDDTLTIKSISETEKEIFLSNIDVVGENITIFKYELGIIEETNIKEYFKNNGKDILSDRIKLEAETDITLYAQNEKGAYIVKYIDINN